MSIWMHVVSKLLPLGLIFGTISGLVILSRQPERFPLRGIEIREDLNRITEGEIRTAVSQHMSEGFFWLDVEAVQKSLKKMPWVSEVAVKRVWPDKIVVSIKEKHAQAKWGEAGLLSTEGEIFFPEQSTIPEKLPQFVGSLLRTKEMNQQYLNFLEILSPIGLTVQGLELTQTGTWKVMLDNGIALILGKGGLSERLSRFVTVYQGSLRAQIQRVAYIDLRYTNGIAIGWKAGVP